MDKSSEAQFRGVFYTLTMRNLDEIVTRRVLEAIREANSKAEGTVDANLIADRMHVFLGGEKESIRKQFKRYLTKNHKWRIDYLQAFCQAVGMLPEQLVAVDARGGTVSEATRAQHLYSALGHRLAPSEARKLILLLQQLLDTRPRYDLAIELARAVLEAKDHANAHLAITKLSQNTKAFESKRRDLRQKPPRTKSRK